MAGPLMMLPMLGWNSNYPVLPPVLSISLKHTWPDVVVHFPAHPRFQRHTHGERYLRMGKGFTNYHCMKYSLCWVFPSAGSVFCRLVSPPPLGQATAECGALPGVMEAVTSPCDDLDNTAGLAAGYIKLQGKNTAMLLC